MQNSERIGIQVFDSSEGLRPLRGPVSRTSGRAQHLPDYYAPQTTSKMRIASNPLSIALRPMNLTVEEAAELQSIIEQRTALPTIPVQGIPEGDRSLLKRQTK